MAAVAVVAMVVVVMAVAVVGRMGWGLGFEMRKPERSRSVHGGSGGLVVVLWGSGGRAINANNAINWCWVIRRALVG